MKKSLTYKKKYYLILFAILPCAILLSRRFIIPAIDTYQLYSQTQGEVYKQIYSPLEFKDLKNAYEQRELAYGVSNKERDFLQLQFLKTIDQCISSYNDLELKAVETKEPRVLITYNVYLTKYILSGTYSELLRSLDCIEKELENGIITSTKFENDEQKVELEFTIQCVTNN